MAAPVPGACAEEAAHTEVTEVPELTLTASRAKVRAGERATLTASVGIAAAELTLRRRKGDGEWLAPRTLTTGADGTVSWPVKPSRTTTWQVEFAGNDEWGAAAAETRIAVMPRVTLRATKSLYAGRRITFKVSVRPLRPGARVRLQRRHNGAWKTMRTFTLNKRSRATIKLKATRPGRPRFRVSMAADAEFAAVASGSRRVRIKNANPYRVPTRPAHFIVVDRSQYKLHYHEHGRIVRSFNCVLGRPGLPTPLGRFRVWARGVNPGGPFGVRVLWYYRGYGIHGTNQPWLLNHFPRAYSHGCTRLSNANALWLFNRCPVGTPVWNVP